MSEIRVALLGYGLAGSVFHAPLVAATPGLRLATVVTSDPARVAAVRAAYPQVRVLPGAGALWRDPDGCSLAVIATPNRSHAPLAEAALQHGFDVVVDKPLATSAVQGERLLEQARRAGRVLSVFQNRRWDSDHLTLRALLASGALGRVHRYEARFERWRPQPRDGWRRSAQPDDGGGVLFDLGSHLVDQALQLFGPARVSHAELRPHYPGSGVDDDSFVALDHESGVVSHLWMNSVAAAPGPRLRVLGSDAAFVKHGLDPQEDALRAGLRPPSPDWGREPASAHGRRIAGDAMETVVGIAGDWPRYYLELRDALRARGTPPVEPADAIAVLRLIEAARALAAARA